MNLTTVFDWIDTALDTYDAKNIIREHGIGPKPAADFITFDIINVLLPDYEYWDKKQAPDELQTILEITTRATFIISVNVYSDTGHEDLRKLKLSNHDFDVQQLFKNEGVSLLDISTIRNLTKMGDTEYIRRFQADFTFYSNEIETYTKQKITQYYLTGQWDTTDIEIDVPKQ